MVIDCSAFSHLYPYKSNFLKLKNGLNLHYVDEGKGSPVFMIHGNPTWSFYYRSLVEELKNNFRTIAVDHIGCGLSDKPSTNEYGFDLESRVSDFKELVDKTCPDEKISLVVHDWGGMIGVVYALQNLEKIDKIIVTNTSGFFPPGTKNLPVRLWLLKYISLFATPAVLLFNLFSWAATFMAPHKKLGKNVKKGLVAPHNNIRNRISTLKFVQDIPLKPSDKSYDLVKFADDNLKKLLEKDMIVIWGEHDFVFDNDYYNEWINRFPKVKSYFFKDAGHYLFEDIPEKINPIIKDFLISDVK
ncbi:MAG: alpha/beta fold hydrolase [Desulfobacterales bacterium]|nr:alpha/beta fold hydrolase [Desulfobacterales bacterium]